MTTLQGMAELVWYPRATARGIRDHDGTIRAQARAAWEATHPGRRLVGWEVNPAGSWGEPPERGAIPTILRWRWA